MIREAPPREYLTKSTNELNMIGEPPLLGEARHGKAGEKESKTLKFLGYNFTIGQRKLTIKRRPTTPDETPPVTNNKQRCDLLFLAKQRQSLPFKNSMTQEIRL